MTNSLTAWLRYVATVAVPFVSVACSSSTLDIAALARNALSEISALTPPIGFLKCDLQREPVIGECTSPDCIANSAALTGFYFGALQTDGCRNLHGLRLVPDALYPFQSCGGPGNVLSLDAENGELVGRSTTGSGLIVCEGSALEDSTFWIEGAWDTLHPRRRYSTSDRISPKNLVRMELRIAKVDAIKENLQNFPSYRIVITGNAKRWDGAAWVSFRISWWPSSDDDDGWKTCRPETSADQQAVLVQDEFFHEDSHGYIHATQRPGWFQLACSESALGKARRRDSSDFTSPPERLAILHAFTARYCGRGTFTFSGVPIELVPATQPSSGGPIEARWSSRGAKCLSHPRLWSAGFRLSVWESPTGPIHFQNCCNTEEELRRAISQWCGGIPLCDPAPTNDDPDLLWRTYVTDSADVAPAPLGPLRP